MASKWCLALLVLTSLNVCACGVENREHHFKMYIHKEIQKSLFGHLFQFSLGRVECLLGMM